MRLVYVLITVFLVVCFFFTRWYLCDLRGLCTFPGDEYVGDKASAIIEIILMLLVAFLIGFAASWILQDTRIKAVFQLSANIMRDRSLLQQQLKSLEKENQSARRYLAERQSEMANVRQREQMAKASLDEAKNKTVSLETDLEQIQRRYENLKQENDLIRDSATRLRMEMSVGRTTEPASAVPPETPAESQVTQEAEAPPTQKPKEVKGRSRFTPSTWQTKNDLTLISGIGPVIQKKLYALGIYTFQQISELTPDDIERVAKELKVFRGRIGRDNWIGQAAALKIK